MTTFTYNCTAQQWAQKWHLPTPTFSWVILNKKYYPNLPLKPLVWWRYIDDVFMIWPHGEGKLNEFVNVLNSCHETIKFTHEDSPSKINFLDVTVLLHNNSIATDLHVKSTDTHQYPLSSSCHPNHVHRKVNPIQPCTKNSPHLLHR